MPSSHPEFYNEDDGLLSNYGLLCGYVEKKVIGNEDVTITIEMYMEHRCIHVRGVLNVEDPYAQIDGNIFVRLFWKSFDDNYEKALEFYKSFGTGVRILRSNA